MFAKVEVNGPNAHPLYEHLKRRAGSARDRGIKWNFTKFLVDADGAVVKRYGSAKRPEEIEKDMSSAGPLRTSNFKLRTDPALIRYRL